MVVVGAPTAQALSVKSPETVRFGGQKVRCGGTVYRAVEYLLSRREGRSSVAAFCRAVWGEVPNSRKTLTSLLWRVNRLLEGLDCPRRLTLDGECVLLL
jgi:DNA-binding SARP family transcriptional activator